MLIEVLDANEDGEVDSFEWTTMLRQVQLNTFYLLDFLIRTIMFRDSCHIVGMSLSILRNKPKPTSCK